MTTKSNAPLSIITEFGHSPSDERGFPIALQASYVLAPIVQQRLLHITQVAAAKQLPVQHSFNAPLFTGTITIPGPERDWHLMPLTEDPAWNNKHGFPVPRDILAQLRRIEEAQLDFDTIYIAHEMPKAAGYLPGPTESARHLAPPVSSKAQRHAAAMGATAANLVKAAFAPVLLTGAVAVAATAVASMAFLDPILFGIVADPNNEMVPGSAAAWVYLCHWDWS